MIAMGMRAHLEILLRAMLEFDLCRRDDIKEFARELERGVLEDTEA